MKTCRGNFQKRQTLLRSPLIEAREYGVPVTSIDTALHRTVVVWATAKRFPPRGRASAFYNSYHWAQPASSDETGAHATGLSIISVALSCPIPSKILTQSQRSQAEGGVKETV
jgi:hypothetical protein